MEIAVPFSKAASANLCSCSFSAVHARTQADFVQSNRQSWTAWAFFLLNSPAITCLQFDIIYPHSSLQQILWRPEVYPAKIWLRLFPAQAVFYHLRIRPDVLYRVGEEGDFL